MKRVSSSNPETSTGGDLLVISAYPNHSFQAIQWCQTLRNGQASIDLYMYIYVCIYTRSRISLHSHTMEWLKVWQCQCPTYSVHLKEATTLRRKHHAHPSYSYVWPYVAARNTQVKSQVCRTLSSRPRSPNWLLRRALRRYFTRSDVVSGLGFRFILPR